MRHKKTEDASPSRDMRELYHQVLEDYVDEFELDVDSIVIDVKFIKVLLPFIAAQDERWKKFPKDRFNTNLFDAHRGLYDAIRNHLSSL